MFAVLYANGAPKGIRTSDTKIVVFLFTRMIGDNSADLCGVGKGGSAPPLPNKLKGLAANRLRKTPDFMLRQLRLISNEFQRDAAAPRDMKSDMPG